MVWNNFWFRFLNNSRISILLVLLFLVAPVSVFAQIMVDASATPLTKKAYASLFEIQKRGVVFGHQDDLAYGVGWKYIDGNSDIKLITGEYPGIYGWDIAHIEKKSTTNIDKVPFDKIKRYIVEGFDRGGLITISWHAPNPLTGGDAWDTTHGTVASILPNGQKHQQYIQWLDRVTAFLQALKTKEGIQIPILFRPFHELTGNWFWWCKNSCSPDEFKQLWRFTVSYLRDKRQLHHLIYVYNTADFGSSTEFLERYPGDEWVDVLSFDRYQFEGKNGTALFNEVMTNQLTILNQVAIQKNKPVALAETGYEAIPDPTWWTATLYPLLKKYPLAFVLVWRNHGFMPSTGKMHHYAPYPGHLSEADFKKFHSFPEIFFETKIRELKIYE
jgi:mannan endo-1,4-beta-mannosidase